MLLSLKYAAANLLMLLFVPRYCFSAAGPMLRHDGGDDAVTDLVMFPRVLVGEVTKKKTLWVVQGGLNVSL